jgi:hypothetical protein
LRRVVIGLCFALAAVGCSSGDDGGPFETNGANDESTELPGLAVIEVLGPDESEGADVPHFEWSAVRGAEEYGVVVSDDEGAVWAWRGTDTDIWFGGLSRERPAGMAGPVVPPGSTWRVAAFDSEGNVVAVSPERVLDT